ncbi:terpenoid synthase [Hymenopellis radicata]|nr:terpenoid synthase [Hymenopellis radicata]
MDLPGTVLDDSVILELTELAVDMVIISNDLYSYNKEQAVGDENLNLVTIVMHQLHIDMAAALNWISDLHADIVNRFLRVWTNIPTYGGPLDRDVRIYVDGLANWVRGNDCWCFECERYFGSSGAEISRTREVKLLPKCV